MSADQKLARSIVDGSLDLICPEMELLVCPAYHDAALSGSGVIRSDDRGQLYFKMAAPFTGTPHLALRRTRPAGEVHDEHDHVMLRAVDQNGHEWRSNWLLLDLQFPTLQPSWLVRHNLESLMSSRKVPHSTKSRLTIHIPNQHGLIFDQATTKTLTVDDEQVSSGWSLDHHKRSFNDSEVVFRKGDDAWLTVVATRDSPIMPDWPGLLCHALEFACARRARPAVVVREFNDRRDTGLFSGPFWQYQSLMPPPVHPREPADAGAFWTLIERFFVFVSGDSPKVERLLNELEGIRNGASGSAQTACLTLAVGIESICDILLPNLSSPKDEDEMTSLLNHIDAWDGDARLRSRAIRLITNMRAVRAVDRLYAWASDEDINHDLIDRWKALRHPRAHGAAMSEDQTSFDQYYAAVELLYRMVTWAIGYDEPILRTSTRGWGQNDDPDSVPT